MHQHRRAKNHNTARKLIIYTLFYIKATVRFSVRFGLDPRFLNIEIAEYSTELRIFVRCSFRCKSTLVKLNVQYLYGPFILCGLLICSVTMCFKKKSVMGFYSLYNQNTLHSIHSRKESLGNTL